ncbi:hypothetical protein OOT46_29275 [Aquabacterium sp. A7-Y]|uniref:hypothetical protein n=1 Tax=Aquabacterium sp. A7-Y TaxID=1349605 RepID=UPI00223CFEF1|nr:hypothetical protein [Aquabacterium sp. A7-Y]MCW7541893.1 hypothetical protein [Aquabacterium sp. A7-Y]
MARPVFLLASGMVTSVGQTAPSACAAIRAKLTNPTETCFIDAQGQPIMAHEVALEQPWRGLDKLARMAALAIDECLSVVPPGAHERMPLLLCVAEKQRPGRLDGLDERLVQAIETQLGLRFQAGATLLPHGRAGAAVALSLARRLLQEQAVPGVLIAATDSLLEWPALRHHDERRRLLSEHNPNGFMPGEGAAAVLVGPRGGPDSLACTGLGFAMEEAHLESDRPLRADGLVAAVRQALGEAGCELDQLGYRIADLSGEQYYFKEAALALTRLLRQRVATFDLWHPAEAIGEAGAASGLVPLAVALAAHRGGYAPGRDLLLHWANDTGQRAAAVLRGA